MGWEVVEVELMIVVVVVVVIVVIVVILFVLCFRSELRSCDVNVRWTCVVIYICVGGVARVLDVELKRTDDKI